MIVYIYNDMFFNKINLPLKVSGVYPLNINERLFLGNVEEKNGSWVFSCGENFEFEGNEIRNIINNTAFVLKDKRTKIPFHVFVSETYNRNTVKFNSINSGSLTIGYNQMCDISYNCDEIEKKDEIINITYNNNAFILETNSRFAFVNDERISRKVIHAGDYLFYYGMRIIFLGSETYITAPADLLKVNSNKLAQKQEILEPINDTDQGVDEDIPLFNKQDYYFKSPRFYSKMEEEEVKIDEPPRKEEDDNMPVLLTLGPQMTMLCTSAVSVINTVDTYMEGGVPQKRFILSLITAGVAALSALFWPLLTKFMAKRAAKKKEAKRQKKYMEYLGKKRQEILLLKNKQQQILIESSPSLDNCKLIIETRPRTLWQKNIEHSDFLSVRLGIGNVQSKIKIQEPEECFKLEDEDNLEVALKNIVNESLMINNVPLALNMVENSKIGVIGDVKLSKRFIDSLFLQIMTFQSYTELKIIVFTKNPKNWDYLKILPHCWDNQKTIRYFASKLEEFNDIAIEIEKNFDSRAKDDEDIKLDSQGEEKLEKDELYKSFKPYYLIFTDDINTIRQTNLVKKIMAYKKNLGFTILMLHDRLSTLPSETSTFINIGEQMSGLITNDLTEENQMQFAAEYCDNIDIYDCAQKLANIPIMLEKTKYELPTSVPFLEMYGVGKIEQLNVLDRWKTNNPVNSLAVPIGIDQTGELFKMDIHEKYHGPHGLVAGTTGSGKSEWIVTYILSLAVNFHPDEVQFVLIDYKGGGLALSFENSELGIRLPHLAGTITNLDKSEIGRAVSSMESELKRRQAIFNEAREKLKEGSMNIYKYQQFYRKKMVSEPLSHLLIICDEFAELKTQQPEFMDSLISISRIGRSLGVHLILATQKPSGVVNDQIWSNSKFKVCLKVQDKSESNEVLKKPDAAFLKQTGAFYLEVGNDDYYNLGQSAWAGAKYYPSEFLKKKIDQSVQSVDNVGRVINTYDLYEDEKAKESKGEQLINIVQYISELSAKENIHTRQLWLKNVEPVQYLYDLTKKYTHKVDKYEYNIAVGEYDEPRKQFQGLLEIDLEKGNVAIMGQPGSGKESLISTIMWSSMIEHTPQEINYYVIDYGAETLKKFSKFPHVGEILYQSDSDRIIDLLEMILDEFDERKNLFSDFNGSFDYYNKVNEKKKPLIVLVINAYDIFMESIPKLADVFDSLFRDAPRYGIIIICSVSAANVLRSRQLQYFNHVIMMQFQDETLYRSTVNCRKDLIPKKTFGRGICKIGLDADSYCEFQTALIAPDEKAYEYIKETGKKLTEYYKVKAKQLLKIPESITSQDLIKYVTTLEEVPIGFNFYEKDIAKYNFMNEKIHIITGKNVKENIKFIYGLTNVLSKHQNIKLRVVDLYKIFNKKMLDIKLFNDSYDQVFAALENDVLNRTDMQELAINIIIGAGDFKTKLTDGGQEIFTNLFNNLIKSKKTIYILIDDYEKIKMLKLEPWYSIIDTTKGIWLGSGFESQSLISSSEVSKDDRKYTFEGLGYTVKDTNYTVIKTVMDGEEDGV